MLICFDLFTAILNSEKLQLVTIILLRMLKRINKKILREKCRISKLNIPLVNENINSHLFNSVRQDVKVSSKSVR
jgi:hypothetical protein